MRLDDDTGASLWFPPVDVRLDRLRDAGCRSVGGGELRCWDADGPAPALPPVGWWRPDPPPPGDGTGVARQWTSAPAGLAALRDHVSFDHDRVLVEVVDTVEGDGPHDVTVKRFPTWGDAADLVAILDVIPDDEGGYVGVAVPDPRRGVVEGSQLLGQAIVAASRHAPGRRVASAHMVFVRAGDPARPFRFSLEELSGGRTFTALAVHADQAGRRCASGTLLLGVPAADVVRHAAPPPEVAGPYDAVPYDMSVTGRDLRVVDAAYTDDPDAPVGPPVIDAWVRFRDVPDDPALHAGLLAQFTGHMSIAAALRPHAGVGQREAHRTMSTAINAIGLSLHADARMDAWVLYRHLATVVADGMAHAECRVHDEGGSFLASFTVDAMVRPLARPAADDRTAL